MNVKIQNVDSTSSVAKRSGNQPRTYLVDGVILLVMCILLFGATLPGGLYYGASWQFFRPHTDAAKYQCYAVAFWQGTPALKPFPDTQCDFILNATPPPISNAAIASSMRRHGFPDFLVHFVESQSLTQSFHALPHEYPFLTVFPYSLGMLAPAHFYQVAFAVWMALLAVLIYFVLARYRSRGAAIAFAVYLVAGAWATAVARFDLVPAALTFFAVLCATRSRWNWAFALLALAFLAKLYPIILLLPFMLAQQKASRDSWKAWRRWTPLATFVGLCVVVMVVSLLLSVEGTLSPFSYFGNRPIQGESFGSSLLWLASIVRPEHLSFEFTFGSLNVISPRSGMVSLLITAMEAAGLLYTWWLQWRGKLDLAASTLLTLLVVMVTGKVFSPQYLIWIIPLLAYVGGSDLRWLISWVIIGLLTTWVYPYIYLMTNVVNVPNVPAFYPVVTVRNILLFGVTLALLVYYTRRKSPGESQPIGA
ncbi:MAG TPA: glycosyltransferase 87 family protein [Ktedonosporobacter sp.]|nr:glycosyltransferase 87 family protein [Ktedonosporobacter sp.]